MVFLNKYILTIILCISISFLLITSIAFSTDDLSSSEKIDNLLSEAKTLLNHSPEKAKQKIDYALKLSKEHDYLLGEVQAYNQEGYYYLVLDTPTKALKKFETAFEYSTENNFLEEKAYSLNGLGLVSYHLSDYTKALTYYEDALTLFESLEHTQGEAYIMNNMGAVHEFIGAYEKALNYYLNGLRLNEKLENKDEIATSLNNVATINLKLNNFEPALTSYNKALDLYEELDYKKEQVMILNNLGNLFKKYDYLNEASAFYNKALKISINEDLTQTLGETFINIASVYESINDFDKSIQFYEAAKKNYSEFKDTEGLISAYINLGSLYLKKGEVELAIKNHSKAYDLSKDIHYKDGLRYSLKNLAADYQKNNQYETANQYYQIYIELENFLEKEAQQEKFANAQTLYETEKKNQEIKHQKAEIEENQAQIKRLIAIIGVAILFIVVVVTLMFIIAKERKKSEKLLLNVLPKKVAEELKTEGHSPPEAFKNVTIFFSDVVNFTKKSSTMEPTVLIKELNEIFTAFDTIMNSHQCERIKTIGDAYFAVSGLPTPNKNHAENITKAAIEILEYLDKRNKTHKIQWEIRIGIHSGAVVGGIVGIKKYIYDLFGDSVNTASRMESNGAPMKINVSKQTYKLLKDDFIFIPREPIEVKGKGITEMFFLDTTISKK